MLGGTGVVQAASAKWPGFRGPMGKAYSNSRELPVHWSTNVNVVWKQRVLGEGWSSPVVSGDFVYLTSAGLHFGHHRASLRVKCYSITDGTRLWFNDVIPLLGSPYHHRKNNYASPTPAVDEEHVYAHFGPLGTACVSTNGKTLWRNTSLPYESRHGAGGSPILVDDNLIFNADGKTNPCVIALNKHNGEVSWRFDRPTEERKKYSFSTPLLIRVAGERQLITAGSGMVNALNPETGKEIWRVRYPGGFSVVPQPVFANGLVFVTSGDDSPPRLLAIRPNGTGDVTDTHIVWETSRGVPVISTPLAVRDQLYFVSDAGVLTCADIATGEVHYQERVVGSVSASPVFGDNKIYIQDEQGECVVIKPGKVLNIVGRNFLNERVLATYAIVDNAIYIRTERHLYCIRELGEAPPNLNGKAPLN